VQKIARYVPIAAVLRCAALSLARSNRRFSFKKEVSVLYAPSARRGPAASPVAGSAGGAGSRQTGGRGSPLAVQSTTGRRRAGSDSGVSPTAPCAHATSDGRTVIIGSMIADRSRTVGGEVQQESSVRL